MSVNFYRALTIVLSIITGSLFYLAAFVLGESYRAYPSQPLLFGEFLVPGILLISALPMACIVVAQLVPRLSTSLQPAKVLVLRLLTCLIFAGLLITGFFLPIP